jgi:OmpR family response regulator RpaB
VIDTNKRHILRNKKEIQLTRIEFNLIELLVANAGEKLSRTYILNSIWGYKPLNYMDTRIVDVHISKLRSKIEKDPRRPNLILTVRGTGYILQYFQNIKL